MIYPFYRLPTKLREGNVFTGVHHSVQERVGGYVSSDDRQVSLAGGMGMFPVIATRCH